MAEQQKRTAAYIPWATFNNALNQLAKGMPSRIDRSVFTGLAWNVQNQLFIALKFFNLLKGEDEPTTLLDELVKGTEEERKAKFKKVVEDSYAELIAIDLTKATRGHFEEKLGELYNVTGDTRVKAVRFFISAATFVGLPLSEFIVPKDGNGSGTKRPRQAGRPKARKQGIPTSSAPLDPPVGPAKPSGTSKTVSLASGGTLTVSATVDWFALNPEDRAFVFGLIDKLEEYAKKVSS